jgi:hypothetical protein
MQVCVPHLVMVLNRWYKNVASGANSSRICLAPEREGCVRYQECIMTYVHSSVRRNTALGLQISSHTLQRTETLTNDNGCRTLLWADFCCNLAVR